MYLLCLSFLIHLFSFVFYMAVTAEIKNIYLFIYLRKPLTHICHRLLYSIFLHLRFRYTSLWTSSNNGMKLMYSHFTQNSFRSVLIICRQVDLNFLKCNFETFKMKNFLTPRLRTQLFENFNILLYSPKRVHYRWSFNNWHYKNLQLFL